VGLLRDAAKSRARGKYRSITIHTCEPARQRATRPDQDSNVRDLATGSAETDPRLVVARRDLLCRGSINSCTKHELDNAIQVRGRARNGVPAGSQTILMAGSIHTLLALLILFVVAAVREILWVELSLNPCLFGALSGN
jgi:hypothetical protein